MALANVRSSVDSVLERVTHSGHGCGLWSPRWGLGLILWGATAVVPGQTSANPADAFRQPGTYAVRSAREDWHDEARNRNVPVKIYRPGETTGPLPVILFSHGLGGSRDGYEYLGRHWASHGFVVLHPQHLGSDLTVWQNKAKPMDLLKRAAADPANAVLRPGDMRFVIDQLHVKQKTDPQWKGTVDLNRIGAGGHSFGAYTVLAVAGQSVGVVHCEPRFHDPRVKAAVAMSAPVHHRGATAGEVYGSIRIPVLHVTGTADLSPMGDTQPADRRVPFDHIPRAPQSLLVLDGADHMVFAGLRRSGQRAEQDPLHHDLVCLSTTAFWQATLRQDAGAQDWLNGGGFSRHLGKSGTFERRPAQ